LSAEGGVQTATALVTIQLGIMHDEAASGGATSVALIMAMRG